MALILRLRTVCRLITVLPVLKLTAVFCFIILSAGITLSAPVTVLADPDSVNTAIEYRGTPDLRLGDSFFYKNFSFGGMVEIRDEARFNQDILPNHNWRGFLSLLYGQPLPENSYSLKISTGYQHESAHPTMGLNDGKEKAGDYIYDGTYRNINLNSLVVRLSGEAGSGYSVSFIADARFYFHSRNTPELAVNHLAWSEGVSGGIEFKYPLTGSTKLFASVFDRYIFEGREKAGGNIYHDSSSGVVTSYEKYPVINNVNTVSAKTGIIFTGPVPDRSVTLYCGILYGNIYGFVDSREKRTVYSIGIELVH